MFEDLPDSLILQILKYLHPYDIGRLSQCSSSLNRICYDNILWRNLFHQYFKVAPIYPQPLCRFYWREEFIRLVDEYPFLEAEVLTKHSNQVLHVSFSNDGHRFATTSKDAFVHVWKSGHPVKLEFSKSMKKFQWKYTQYSQFNESNTLLLVSGVLFESNTSGEIAVFNLNDFQLQCRVLNKPYDIFGIWYSDTFLLSGDLKWLGNLVSKSIIWLNKSTQEIDSEHSALMNRLYRFYNPKASSIRSIMIANCVSNEIDEDKMDEVAISVSEASLEGKIQKGNAPSNPFTPEKLEVDEFPTVKDLLWKRVENVSDITYTAEFHSKNQRKRESGEGEEDSPEPCCSKTLMQDQEAKRVRRNEESPDSGESQYDEIGEDETIDPREKWLIFTCGSETYTPHQIGFKKILPIKFKGRIDPGPCLKDRMEEFKRKKLFAQENPNLQEQEIDYSDYAQVAVLFDDIDHKIDVHGHIIGMALSPDHRHLYVNSRPWPTGYKITDPLAPPPIAQEIDIHVIDLVTLKQVGMMRRAHRAYTPNEECFFIFLDAAECYLASGAEDRHAYIWDRHYGISLAKLPHLDVVNSVAINPKDETMMVSVSDDFTIKVWRSKSACRNLGLDTKGMKRGTKLFAKHRSRTVSSNIYY